MRKIFFGLGSNIGNKLENLKIGVELLSEKLEMNNLLCSGIYESTAMLPDEIPNEWKVNFYNMVICGCIKIENPLYILSLVKDIESQMGRDLKAPRWSPRVIDIDILLFDRIKFENEFLKIPHPQIVHRPFVIKPLLELYEKSTIFCDVKTNKICDFKQI